MKVIMYHYVRPGAEGLPHFPYLALEDFLRQLDYLKEAYGFVDRESFQKWREGGIPPEGALLTFDDGLRDHVDYVLPTLKERGLWGLFYIPSKPIVEREYLDVHKVHLVLGRIGGKQALEWIGQHHPEVATRIDWNRTSYFKQSSDESTKRIKHLFNWELPVADREEVLNDLFEYAFDGALPDWHSFYLQKDDLKRLLESGMGVGGHGHAHLIQSKLGSKAKWKEIQICTELIKTLVGHLDWGFCWAHGSPKAVDSESEEIASDIGYPFAFAVKSEDIDARLSYERRYALPRHNCNEFAYGSASYYTS